MTQFSSEDYSTLKYTLLEMWIPPVGAETYGDVLTKIIAKGICFFLGIDKLPVALFEEKGIFKELLQAKYSHLFDAQPPFQLDQAMLTGSLREGLSLYTFEPPDVDIMCVLKNITFSQEDQRNSGLQLREDTPFVYAFVTRKETQQLWREFFHDSNTGTNQLSSRKIKEKLQHNYENRVLSEHFQAEGELKQVDEGAAATFNKPKPFMSVGQNFKKMFKKILRVPVSELKNQNIKSIRDSQTSHDLSYLLVPSNDVVLSIFCEGWPYCAKEWMKRERLWPDLDSVTKIAQSGFHIVPKSSPDGDFRLSFSRAECILIENLLPLQHKVMRAFKAVVKYHENTWAPNMQKVLSSYHLKTIAFWHFEKISSNSWSEETIVHHLVALLKELAEALRIQNLPMYFLPKFNLLQDVDDPEVTLNIMEKIFQLSRNFLAMSEAVNNSKTYKLFCELEEFDQSSIAKVFQDLNEEKLKRAKENEEVPITVYDVLLPLFFPHL